MADHTLSLVLSVAGMVGGALLTEHCLREAARLPKPLAVLNGIGAGAGILLCLIFTPILVVLLVDLFTGSASS